MSNRIIETRFITDEGFVAYVTFNASGYRCGYIGVPKSHYTYQDISEIHGLDVHGGITYSDCVHPATDEDYTILWWHGFDCSHYNDGTDIAARQTYFPDNSNLYSTNGAVRTLQFCITECKRLSKQLDQPELYI